MATAQDNSNSPPLFVDAFAGCGGLSLGLLRAGWRQLFAIERDPFAFGTFKHNLLDGKFQSQFDWPEWLPREAHCIDDLLQTYAAKLREVSPRVTLLAGGPPCQGFSSAGRRDAADPRNGLMRSYLELVRLLRPSVVLLENVRGITVDFSEKVGAPKNYASELRAALAHEYDVFSMMANAADFGVPQARVRFILIAVRGDSGMTTSQVGSLIESARCGLLRAQGIVAPTSSQSALSDLEVRRNGIEASGEFAGFSEILYSGPRTHYQRLMRDGHEGAPADTRLARHRPEIAARFSEIIERSKREGRLNVSLSREAREEYGLRKQALRVLDPERPSPTITSMPDDLLHYSEPRTLTVRENARLQSFPDWFAFQGKYTSGGHMRRREVPRYTQVANAVPPLMAEALATAIRALVSNSSLVQGNVNQHSDVDEVPTMIN